MSEPAITDLQDWLAALSQTSVLIELGALLACALLAWLLARLVWILFDRPGARSVSRYERD